ncbi:MAG: tetratricopeptide repeat protein [Aeoliella sp.]
MFSSLQNRVGSAAPNNQLGRPSSQPTSLPAAQVAIENKEKPPGADRIKPPLVVKKPTKPLFTSEPGLALISDKDSAPKFQPKSSAPPQRVASKLASPSAALPQVVGPAQIEKAPLAEAKRDVATLTPQRVETRPAAVPEAAPQEIINQHVAIDGRSKETRANLNRSPIVRSVRPASAERPLRSSPLPLSATAAAAARRVGAPKNPVAAIPVAPIPPIQNKAQPSERAVALLAQANQLSQTATTEGEYSAVVRTCRQALAIDSSPAAVNYSKQLASWALNRRGEVKADAGRDTEALLDYEDALRLDPKRWRAIHNRGVIAAQAGRFADAFDDFNRTIELNPKFAKAYSNRGTLYVQADKLEKALVDFRLAIANDPDLAVAHKGRARVCHMLGDYDTALQHFDAAMLLAPGDARIVNSRGDLLSDMGHYRAAATNYQRAIEIDSHLAAAYRNLAWLQSTCPDKGCRNHELALANANQAINLAAEPTDLDYDTLAAAQAAAGEFEAATASMDQALKLAAEADKANYEWRRGLYAKGQPYVTEPASSIQQASYAN